MFICILKVYLNASNKLFLFKHSVSLLKAGRNNTRDNLFENIFMYI